MAEVTTLAVQAIEARIHTNLGDFRTDWTESNVAWQGVDFDPPDNDWMRPVVLFAGSEWFTSGASGVGVNVVRGILTCSFFTHPGFGYEALDGYASAFRELFDRASIALAGHGAIEFDPAGGPRPGPFDGAWIQSIVDCPFLIEEHGT